MLLKVDDITQPITEWALDYGIPVSLILFRLECGWSAERAVTEPMPVRSAEKQPTYGMVDKHPQTKRPRQMLTHNGVTLSLIEWAELSGLAPMTLRVRLSKGWPVEKALGTPAYQTCGPVPELIEFGGARLTIRQWAAGLGITKAALHSRLNNRAWTLEDALTKRSARGERRDLERRAA